MTLLIPAPAAAAEAGFKARITALASDGSRVGERDVECRRRPACGVEFDIPFQGEVWSMGVRLKQTAPDLLNAWVVGDVSPLDSWGRPTGFREFSIDSGTQIELDANWIDHRKEAIETIDPVTVAIFRIRIL